MVRVKVPKSKDDTKVTIVEKAYFLVDEKPIPVGNAGRDKHNNFYYDLNTSAIMPTSSPYVIVLKIKEINKEDRDAFQQAVM
jgi:hypothetical protein